jgi:ribonuclease HI
MRNTGMGRSIHETLQLILYIDGASRGNPGNAGAGVWITNREGKEIVRMSRYLGHKTNNEAEYWALLLGLREAKRLGGNSIRIFTDSELIERQVKGLYRVKDLNLKTLHRTVIRNLKEFSSFEIESIPREQNREADLLANQAIQKRIAEEKRKEGIRRGTDGRSS